MIKRDTLLTGFGLRAGRSARAPWSSPKATGMCQRNLAGGLGSGHTPVSPRPLTEGLRHPGIGKLPILQVPWYEVGEHERAYVMSAESDYFKFRQESKTYISKLFHWNERDTEGKRKITMVMEGSDELKIGEIKGAMCLRLTGEKRKTQITAVVTQDEKQIQRLTLQTFKTRAGDWIEAIDKDEFTFRSGEFDRLLNFLSQIEFIDLSNKNRFQIEDISTQAGPKVIVDAPDRNLLSALNNLSGDKRKDLLGNLQSILTEEDVNILLGRKQGLEDFAEHLSKDDWKEADWQDFFEREQWVFGYGLDYRIQRSFDREMTVGGGGTDNKDKPVIDFLQTFKDYTVLVEIKRPATRIFKTTRGGRSGTWEFSSEFISAVSQIIEQKAEWLAFAQTGDHYNRAGTAKLLAQTRNSKAILVIGSHQEFVKDTNVREAEIKRNTFELFRQENRSIDIITYDELFERAQFITRK